VRNSSGFAAPLPAPAQPPALSRPSVDVRAVVARLQQTKAQVKHAAWVDGRPANYTPAPGFQLPPELAAILGRARALPLYSHQSKAIAAALAGDSVVVSTPTASGKSICYLAPLLHLLSDVKRGTALVLMPLKALANDQLRATRALLVLAGECADAAEVSHPPALPAATIARLRRIAALSVETYDGDLNDQSRPEVRKSVSIVFTNIDMLHTGILPNHRKWPVLFWANLKAVVLDEAHVYAGVFGSHAALVLRRLLRITTNYGSSPAFLCCSATVANPGEHIQRLCGRAPVVITENGAPGGPKAILLWQPPECADHGGAPRGAGDSAKPQHKSAYQETGEAVAELVASGLRPLVFVAARKLAEIVASAARVALKARSLHTSAAGVESYRAGYTSADRRELELRLSGGSISALVTTSALELGIDVGELDATVHVGVPLTGSAQWQQAGRAGRRGGSASLALIIATERPLDLFYLDKPEELKERKPEAAFIDPANLALLILHLGAAAFELKLVTEDAPLFGGKQLFAAAIQGAVNAGAISFEPGIRAYGCLLNSPAVGIGIRGGTSRETYQLHDIARMERGEAVPSSLVEAVEASHAFFKIHEGAIFHHRACVYEVVSLDLNSRVARARLIHDSPLNTAARDRSTVQEVTVFRSRAAGATQAWVGRLHVTTHVVGFVKINMVKGENIFEKNFPPPGLKALDFQTDGVWFELPKELVNRLTPSGALREACAGMRNLALALLPSVVACEPGDIGCHVVLPSDSGDGGDASLRVYIYDTFGGVGLCQQVYDKLEQMWRTCLAVLESCACATGCASCTQAGRHGRDGGMAKNETCVVLQGLLGAWMGGGRASIHSTSTGGGPIDRR